LEVLFSPSGVKKEPPKDIGRPVMSKRMQVYYNAVFGGLGGLLGW
jgi:hypothetical protein